MSAEPCVPHRPVQRPVQGVRPIPEVQYDMVDHMPNYDEKKEAARCKMPYCTWNIFVFCDKCNIHLCFVPHWNCLKAAHWKWNNETHENIHKLMSSQVPVPFQVFGTYYQLISLLYGYVLEVLKERIFSGNLIYCHTVHLLCSCACSDCLISLSSCRLRVFMVIFIVMASLLFPTHRHVQYTDCTQT